MDEKKKGNSGVIIIVILILGILCLGGYILVDKDIISIGHDKETVTQENETKDDDDDKDESTPIDINNSNIVSLFNNTHILLDIPGALDDTSLNENGYNVNDLTEKQKIALAYREFGNKVSVTNNYTYYEINAEDVRVAYEKIFGPNTFKYPSQILYGYCTLTLNYDATKKIYSTTNDSGCGGTNPFKPYETIISATRYNDRIEIISAVVYEDQETSILYKDSQKTTKLENIPSSWESIGAGTNYNEYVELREQYIRDNKDKLQQYTYTYKLNNDGFYYIEQAQKTKE